LAFFPDLAMLASLAIFNVATSVARRIPLIYLKVANIANIANIAMGFAVAIFLAIFPTSGLVGAGTCRRSSAIW